LNLACDCDYHRGGCSISIAPAGGHKCHCVYRGFWACHGKEFQCEADEACPANCRSRSCCINGGGDCGGYPTFG